MNSFNNVGYAAQHESHHHSKQFNGPRGGNYSGYNAGSSYGQQKQKANPGMNYSSYGGSQVQGGTRRFNTANESSG